MMKYLFVSAALGIASSLSAQIVPNYLKRSGPGFLNAAPPPVKLDIIGGGAVSGTSSGGTGQTLGKGATGLAFYKEGYFQGDVIFNVGTNQTLDFTNKSINGAALLVPGNTGQSFQVDFRQFNIFKQPKFGFNFSAVYASGDWKLRDTSFNANLVSSKLQFSYILLNPPPTEKFDVLLTADLGVTYRGILGDVASEKKFIKDIFGTEKASYLGTELNVELTLNDFRLFFHFPYIFGETVKGLTNGQFIIGGAVSGKVFKNITNN